MQIQRFIRDEIDKTFDPIFSMKTALLAESLGIDPDEYQKYLDNLSKMKNT